MLAAGGCGPGRPNVSRPFATLLRKLLCTSSMICFSVLHISPANTGGKHPSPKSCQKNSILHFSKKFQTGSGAHVTAIHWVPGFNLYIYLVPRLKMCGIYHHPCVTSWSRYKHFIVYINLYAPCVLYIVTGVSLLSRERFLYI